MGENLDEAKRNVERMAWQQERLQLKMISEISVAEAEKAIATMTPQLVPDIPNIGAKISNGGRRATVQNDGRVNLPGKGLGRSQPPSSQLASTVCTPSSMSQVPEPPMIPDVDLTAISSRADEELALIQSQIDEIKPLEPIEAVLTDLSYRGALSRASAT